METELTIALKKFFKGIVNTYGEDMAYAIATWNENIKDAVNCYSSNKFIQYDINDFYIELLKNEVLCNENENMMVDVTKKLLSTDDNNSIFDSLKYNSTYRRMLIKSFIDNSNISFEEKLSKCNDDRINFYLDTIGKIAINNIENDVNKNLKIKR